MSNLKAGRVILSVQVRDMFMVRITSENGYETEMNTGVSTENATRVTSVVLQQKYNQTFTWDDKLELEQGEHCLQQRCTT